MFRLPALAAFVLAAAGVGAAARGGVGAGVSFIPPAQLAAGERIAFRADLGGGWNDYRAHSGPLDRGMFAHRLFDFALAPGPVAVETRLVRGGRTLARIESRLTAERDRCYFVQVAVQTDDPTRGCMGCGPAVSVPVAGDSQRRLWVYSSFNGISRPILF